MIVWDNYTYQHDVDDRNNCQKRLIIIGKTWATSYCPDWIFEFLIGMADMNILLAWNTIYAYEPKENIEFLYKIAKVLLNNTYQLAEK